MFYCSCELVPGSPEEPCTNIMNGKGNHSKALCITFFFTVPVHFVNRLASLCHCGLNPTEEKPFVSLFSFPLELFSVDNKHNNKEEPTTVVGDCKRDSKTRADSLPFILLLFYVVYQFMIFNFFCENE